MKTTIIEATNGPRNWGKFMVGIFDADDWARRSEVNPAGSPLLTQIGMSPGQVWVLDLQTGEGACFRHGGLARADLNKHQVWVCPLFEPFLEWLYTQDLKLPLPTMIDLPHAPFMMSGYRREGLDTRRARRR